MVAQAAVGSIMGSGAAYIPMGPWWVCSRGWLALLTASCAAIFRALTQMIASDLKRGAHLQLPAQTKP